MKHSLLFFLLITVGRFFHLAAQQADGVSLSSKTYAVIIGITNYQNPAIPALQYADKDAQQFDAWLQSKSGGEVPQKNIQLLLNNEATIAAIYSALDWLKEQCKENDNAYIYFSGHGDIETKNNYSKGYLLAYNSPQNNYANNAIRIEDFNNTSIALTTKNKTKVIIISDACHSGKLAGDFFKGKQLVASQLNQVLNNQVRLASCKEDELAAEGPNWGGGRGVFSYYLILGLQGLAMLQKDSTIILSNLNNYLNTAFSEDKFLIQNQHAQHPVSDGNPNFPMAYIDAATVKKVRAGVWESKETSTNLPIGLMALKPLQRQPIDYFFSQASTIAIESILNFDYYKTLDATAFPSKVITDCIVYQKELYQQRDSANNTEIPSESYEVFNLDSLNMLAKELQQNSSTGKRFVEKFIQMVHEKGQEMINAYIKGDLDELEKRQYYYSGERDYRKHISMLQMALKFTPSDHQLSRILWVHYYYLSGLIDRLQMALQPETGRLLAKAFENQRKALGLEPYAAYILNEMGNLHLHKSNYDSATYFYNLASVVSPTWAIPWSNKIRLNLALGKLDAAERDIHIADSLQQHLAFVFINAGRVMEKKKNLLAAESYYLRAIKENNVHYLPYERLSTIYLHTGDYAKANYFFYQTQIRRKDFAVNDKDFEYGVELGGVNWNETSNEIFACSEALPESTTLALYLKLYHTLKKSDKDSSSKYIIDTLHSIINQKSDIPLVYHYLGKKYYEEGNWQLAQEALKKSLSHYLYNDDLLKKIARDIIGDKVVVNDTCKVKPFLNLQYDVLEDRYMLADIFEKNGDNDNSFEQYNLISIEENKRQMEQASYIQYDSLSKSFAGPPYELNNYLTKATENPVVMIGAIKAARLHEMLKQYHEAERILLQQVELSRNAGDIRQKAINEQKPGWNVNGIGTINFYWLAANNYLEGEVYNFYRKMLLLYPRDSYWQGRLGLFLYHRLRMAFEQIPVVQYSSFWESISQFAYPWVASEGLNENFHFTVPGTRDSLVVESTTYDPVIEALNAINLSIRFSGEITPSIENTKALAALYSWKGDVDQSIEWYHQALALNPTDWKFRNEFIYYLSGCAHSPEACNQLQVVYEQKRATQTQTIQLANWLFLSGQSEKVIALYQKLNPINKEDKRTLLLLKARNYSLQGNSRIALNYYLDSVSAFRISDKESYETKVEKENENIIRLYAIARQYALLKKYDLAFAKLQQALDEGLKYEYLLQYDEAWAYFRDNKQWKNLLSKYQFELEEPNTFINPIRYRIPKR